METRLIVLWRGAIALIAATLMISAPCAAENRSEVARHFEEMTASVKATMLAEPKKGVAEASSALVYARRTKSSLMQATAEWLLGEAYSRVDQPDQAKPLLDQAERRVAQSESSKKLYADIMLSKGSVLAALGDIGNALTNLQHAHELFRQVGDERSRAKALILIALLHTRGNDQTSALKYLDQAIEAYKADDGLLLSIFNARGNAFKDSKRFPQAEQQYSAALVLARKMKSDVLVATVLSNIARVRLEQKHLDEADRAIAEGSALTRRADVAPQQALFIALNAQSAYQHGDLARARRLIDMRFAGVDLSKTSLSDRDAHEAAYHIYGAVGDDRLALEHLAALKRLDDQATELARSNSAALAGARFDFANQELRITQLKADSLQKSIAFERDRARTQRLIFAGVAAATMLVIALLLFGVITLRRSRDRLAVSNAALGKALAAKTEFLATTSHEIRTPLNGILGMTQVMLADPALNAATRDRLTVVHGAGTTMRALVDDILDVAKMETGKMTVEEAPFDVRETIRDASRMWLDQARAKDLHVDLSLDQGPGAIVGDSARVRQIVFNLLSNAVKFTAEGRIAIATKIDGDRWQLSVTDTGIGIASEHHEEIFEAFRQADAGTTRQFGGTGLGLSICRNLSRAMGGDVTVESALGAGATFVLDLPLIAAEPIVQATTSAAGPIAVLERNPITRAMLKTVLDVHGRSVTFAASVDELVAARGAADTVLIDQVTLQAEPDHLNAVRRLRAALPTTRFLLLGPAISAEDQSAIGNAGIDAFLIKPISKDALIAAVLGEPNFSALVPEAA